MGTHVNVTPKVQMSSSSAENAVYTENSIAVKWMVFNQASASGVGGKYIYILEVMPNSAATQNWSD